MTKDEFYQKQESDELRWEQCSAYEETVDPNDIIVDKEWNSQHPEFWNHHGRTKDEYMDYVRSGQSDNVKPPEVYKCGEKYVLVDVGNHRVAAAQEQNRPMKVNVTGEYIDKSQEQDAKEEEEMSM